MYGSMLQFPSDLFAEFDALQRQLEDWVGVRGGPSSIRSVGRGVFPAVNIGSTPDAIDIYAFAPGIDASKLDVSVDKGVLTISGERQRQTPDGGDKTVVYARERMTGKFRRVMSLPDDVDPDRVDATYRNGVLCIRIHRRESSKPRRITVQ